MKLGLINLVSEGQSPPMGLVSIATYLKEYMNFENIRIIDINVEDALNGVKKYNPDVVGISSMTVNYSHAIKLAKDIRQKLEIPIIVGGVHISTLPSTLTREFDIGVIGEGEQTMLELMELYEKKGFDGKSLNGISGITFLDNGRQKVTKKRELITPIDKIPILDRAFLDKSYFEPRKTLDGKVKIEAHMMTSRGCPYRCVFCSTSVFWEHVRFNSAKRVVDEVKELIEKYNVQAINIWDDLFGVNKIRLRNIANKFQEEKINEKVVFSCQPRANLVNDELCQILKDMGVVSVNFGFESGSQKILNYLKKGSVSVEDNKNAIKLCKKYGFLVGGSLMFGSPGETIQDMEDTLNFIKFMKQNNVDLVWSFVTTPFPGTEIWDIAKERGKVNDEMDWNTLSHHNAENPLLLDESIDKKEFKKIFIKGRAQLKYFERKHWMRTLMDNPIWTIKRAISRPEKIMELLFKKV